jgi:hypothetical protein
MRDSFKTENERSPVLVISLYSSDEGLETECLLREWGMYLEHSLHNIRLLLQIHRFAFGGPQLLAHMVHNSC